MAARAVAEAPGDAGPVVDALAEGRVAEAVALAEAMAASRPADARAHGLRSATLLALARPEPALAAAVRAAALAPAMEWPHRLRSLALRRLGRWAEAAEAAREAIRVAPECAAGHAALGLALAAGRRDAQAREALRHAVDLEPRDAELRLTLGDVSLAAEPAAAEAEYRAALEMAPDSPRALLRLGLALERQRRDAEAARAWDAAERADPRLVTPRRRRREGIRMLQAGAALFLAVVALGLVPSLVGRAFPQAARAAVTAVWLFALLVPVGLLLWSGVRLARTRGDGTLDVEIAAVARTLAHQSG
jgi:tetratricopeptide (TPR) repeat protein